MADIWMDVDTALASMPVNSVPLVSDTDFKTIDATIAYNEAGMALRWNFVTTAGVMTSTAVTPTTSGLYDWAHAGGGMYTIEMPASGGTSGADNNTEGFGWWSGKADGVLPFRGPIIGFRAAALNNALIDSATGLNDFADALLKRDMSAVSGEAARSPLNALRLLRNKTEIAGGTLNVYNEADDTVKWSATVGSNPNAEPITGIDPA